MKLPILLAGVLALGLSVSVNADDGYVSADRGYSDGSSCQYSRRCGSCGTVARIDVSRYRDDRRTSGAGAVVGALVGAAIGNQVGSGDGRKAATVAGAVAGGVAGNRIERNRNERDRYVVVVRMDSGRQQVVEQRDLNGVREGSRVVLRNGKAHLL